MRDAPPKSVRREDYRPPAYLIDRVELELELDAHRTRVTGTFSFRRNPAGDGGALTLLGEQQELLRAFTTPFLDAYLKDDASARAFLADGLAAATEGRATYEFDAD